MILGLFSDFLLLWFNFLFLISSWCRLCWQPMTAGKKKIKIQKKKRRPSPNQRLKKQNLRGEEWRGSYCLGGPWNLLQSMNRIVLRKEHRWLAGRTRPVFPTSVYILGFKFAWILTLCLIKKQCLLPCCVSFFVSVCLCLCACSCSLERGVVFLM